MDVRDGTHNAWPAVPRGPVRPWWQWQLADADQEHRSTGAQTVDIRKGDHAAGMEHELTPATLDGTTVPVAVVTSRAEAELIVGLLRNYDVQASVAADDAGGLEPMLQAQGVRVLVAPSDEASARRILAAVNDDRARSDDAEGEESR
jgi:hypothetical protein